MAIAPTPRLVFNIMLGRGLGGIEQAFVDYSLALQHQGYSTINIVHPRAKIRSTLLDSSANQIMNLHNFGFYDLLAIWRLRHMIQKHQPYCIITHGNRAGSLARKAAVPVISVCHNYSYARLLKADYLIATTEHMRQAIIKDGYPAEHIFKIPNMVRQTPTIGPSPKPQFVIGAMGRFEYKKGFDVLVHAIAELRHSGISCNLLLAGEGKEKRSLQRLVADLQLQDIVTFTGWVHDKASFFAQCDVFCLPSRHEPFGIVLLEAFAHGIPVVSTTTEGPSEIARAQDVMFVPVDNILALAHSLGIVLQDKELAHNMAYSAYKRLCTEYTMPVVADRIDELLQSLNVISGKNQKCKSKI